MELERKSDQELAVLLDQTRADKDGESFEFDPFFRGTDAVFRQDLDFKNVLHEGKGTKPGGSMTPVTRPFKTRPGFVGQWVDSSGIAHDSMVMKFGYLGMHLPSALEKMNFLVGNVVVQYKKPVAHVLRDMIACKQVAVMLRMLPPLDLMPYDIPEDLRRRCFNDEGWFLVGSALGRVLQGTPKLQLGALVQPRDTIEARNMLLIWLGYVRRHFWPNRRMTPEEERREARYCGGIWESSEDTPAESNEDDDGEGSDGSLQSGLSGSEGDTAFEQSSSVGMQTSSSNSSRSTSQTSAAAAALEAVHRNKRRPDVYGTDSAYGYTVTSCFNNDRNARRVENVRVAM